MMFFLGMEETPFDGGTPTNVDLAGHRIALGGIAKHAMDTLTGWTSIQGTRPTIEYKRFKQTSATGSSNWDEWNTALGSGDFDVRMDFSIVTGTNTSNTVRMDVVFDANNRLAVTIGTSGWLFLKTIAGTGSTVSTTTGMPRMGTMRITRTGNVFHAYAWDFKKDNWTDLGNFTQAFSGSPKVRTLTNDATSLKSYVWNVRSVFPTQTSGNWESADLDTVDGLRGLWWHTIAGTGTVLVEYKTAATQAGLASASYGTATSGQRIDPSASNRWVKVKVSFSSGSTTAASPEVGPILVNSSVSQDNMQLLFKRAMAGAVRQTDSNYRMAFGEAPHTTTSTSNYSTALWSRTARGLCHWFAQGNGPSFTFEGTTVDLSTYVLNGIDQQTVDNTSFAQLNVEGSWFWPALYEGRATIVPLMTNTQKANWTSRADGQIGSTGGVNQNSMVMLNRRAMNLMHTYDSNFQSGSVLPYADSNLDTNWSNLEGKWNSAGGFWNDNNTDSHYDAYSTLIAANLAVFCQLYASYSHVSNGDIMDRVNKHLRVASALAPSDFQFVNLGRSLGPGYAFELFRGLYQKGIQEGSFHKLSRDVLGAAVWVTLTNAYAFGGDFVSNMLGIGGSATAPETYTAWAYQASWFCEIVAYPYSNATFWATAFQTLPSLGANTQLQPGSLKGAVRGSNTKSPVILLDGINYSADNQENYPGKYNTRILSPKFVQNVGLDSGRPSPAGQGLVWRDTGLSSGNVCHLGNPSTKLVFRLGRMICLWRSGAAKEFSGTVVGGTTATTQTEVTLAKDHHVVNLTKLALGARTANPIWFYGLPIPLYSTASALVNTATGSLYAYGESPDGLLSCQLTKLEGVIDTATASDLFGTAANLLNRLKFAGYYPSLKVSSNQTGTQYIGVDMALWEGQMTAATEAAYISSYSRSTDVITFQANGDEDCYVNMASGGNNPTIGSYTATGSAVRAFSGKTGSTPSYFGGANVTAVSHSTAGNLVAIGSAGNVSVDQVDSHTTRVYSDQGDITIYQVCLPTSPSNIYGYDVNGVPVDVTASCTINTGTSVVIPSSLVTTYKFGLAQFDVVDATGSLAIRRLGRIKHGPGMSVNLGREGVFVH